MILDVTPASPTANSYVTVPAASEFLAGRPRAQAWFAPGIQHPLVAPQAARQAQVLIWATQLLDENINWFGQPLTRTQALAWPMTGQVDQYGRWIDQHTIPLVVQKATAFYGLLLLQDRRQDPDILAEQHVKSRTSQKTTVVYRDAWAGRDPSAAIPAEIRQMLRFYGTITGSAIVPLRRA